MKTTKKTAPKKISKKNLKSVKGGFDKIAVPQDDVVVRRTTVN